MTGPAMTGPAAPGPRGAASAVDFRLRLTPLTPVAVGSGRVLNRFDYTQTVNPRSGMPLLRVIDTERFIAEAAIPPEKKVEAIEKRQAGTLDRFSRYVLSCSFREAREGIELLEFHRDSVGRPLVPASAMRGLLRTAVLHSILSKEPERLREGVAAAMEGRWRRDRAAEKLERRVLGVREEDPLRRLRVREPAPVSNEDLRAYEVAVMGLAGGPPRPKMTLFLEAIDPRSGATFDFPVRIEPAPPRARSGPAEALLAGREPFLGALRAFSAALLEAERRFYREAGARDLSAALEAVARRAEGRVAVPFGFGAGWRAKTMGLLLGPAELQRLAPLLSPGRSYYRRGPAVVFPKTRRWVLAGGRPSEPLGWAALE